MTLTKVGVCKENYISGKCRFCQRKDFMFGCNASSRKKDYELI